MGRNMTANSAVRGGAIYLSRMVLAQRRTVLSRSCPACCAASVALFRRRDQSFIVLHRELGIDRQQNLAPGIPPWKFNCELHAFLTVFLDLGVLDILLRREKLLQQRLKLHLSEVPRTRTPDSTFLRFPTSAASVCISPMPL